MGLIELSDLSEVMPEVAKHLKDGFWTEEAEQALLGELR